MSNKLQQILVLLTIMLTITILTSCAQQERQYLTTQDNVKIAYNFTKGGDMGFILLHQLGSNRSAYNAFYDSLVLNNYSVIAIDFRGHGDSDLDYNNFTEKDWKNLRLDVQAARDFLAEQNIYKVIIVGASIGANTALQFGAQDGKLLGLILISPGEDYHGVKTLDYASTYTRPIMIIVGEEDIYSYNSTQKIYAALGTPENRKQLTVFRNNYHGTEQFKTQATAYQIFLWLRQFRDVK